MVSRIRTACVRVGAPLALALTLALAIALTGCGGSSEDVASKSASEILAASRTSALGSSSVHVLSKASVGGLSLTTDLQLTRDGGRAQVSFIGRTYEAIRIGNTLYVKGNLVFYKSLDRRTGLHIPQGAWVKGPANGTLASFASFTDVSRELPIILASPGSLTKGATKTIAGQKTIELKETGKLFTGARYIATTGEPYPIQIVKHGRETGQTTFSGWNDPVTLSAPAGAVELSSLEHHGGA